MPYATNASPERFRVYYFWKRARLDTAAFPRYTRALCLSVWDLLLYVPRQSGYAQNIRVAGYKLG